MRADVTMYLIHIFEEAKKLLLEHILLLQKGRKRKACNINQRAGKEITKIIYLSHLALHLSKFQVTSQVPCCRK